MAGDILVGGADLVVILNFKGILNGNMAAIKQTNSCDKDQHIFV